MSKCAADTPNETEESLEPAKQALRHLLRITHRPSAYGDLVVAGELVADACLVSCSCVCDWPWEAAAPPQATTTLRSMTFSFSILDSFLGVWRTFLLLAMTLPVESRTMTAPSGAVGSRRTVKPCRLVSAAMNGSKRDVLWYAPPHA